MAEHMGRIGAELETRADLAELGCLLEDRHIVPCLQKVCRRSQSTDACSGDDDLVPFHFRFLGKSILFADKLVQACVMDTITREPAMS